MPANYGLLAVVIAAILTPIIDNWLSARSFPRLLLINRHMKRKNTQSNLAKQSETLQRLYAKDRARHGKTLRPNDLPAYSSLFNPPIEMELRRRFSLKTASRKKT